MEKQGAETHVTTDEARGGVGLNVMRWVLLISLLLAIAALSAIWMTGAATSDHAEKNGPVSGQATPSAG